MTRKEPDDYFALAQRDEQHRHWKLAKRVLTLVFFVAVAVLLFMLVDNLNWLEVKQALHAYERETLVMALAVALVSYIAFSSYDVLGRAYTGHPLPVRQILPVAFVCYAFNLNLSSWIGGVAMRYRLYSRLGLRASTITRVLSLSVFTNSLGYIIVAGFIFSAGWVKLPASWGVTTGALQIVGALMLMLAVGYLLLCQFSSRRSWYWSTHEITLPGIRLALAQAGLSTLNWLLMAWLIFILLPDAVSYSAVLGILLISGIAGMIAQIPAGLGVLEAVFIGILHHQLPTASIVAALIAYRVIYFLFPLMIACVVYVALEGKVWHWQRRARRSDTFQEIPGQDIPGVTVIRKATDHHLNPLHEKH